MEWLLDVVEKFSNTFNFDNIGAKIKKLTKWTCWISILLIWVSSFFQVIAWICLELYGLLWIPIISAIITPYLIWMSSWFSYGFGELVENSCKNERNTRGDEIKPKEQANVDDGIDFAKYERLLKIINIGAGAKSVEAAINMFADFYIKSGKNIPTDLYSNIENLSKQTKYENLLKILEIGLQLTGIENVTNKLIEFYTASGIKFPNDI